MDKPLPPISGSTNQFKPSFQVPRDAKYDAEEHHTLKQVLFSECCQATAESHEAAHTSYIEPESSHQNVINEKEMSETAENMH